MGTCLGGLGSRRRETASQSTFRFYVFRGSSAGLMKVMPPGPVKLIWRITSSFRCPGVMSVIRGQHEN
jgi:hypothetical protein